MEDKEILIADKGMVYTNGTVFGGKIFYVTEEQKKYYYQITESEYEDILKKQREDIYEATTNT